MKKSLSIHTLAGAALFGLGLTTGLVAQTYTDSRQRVEQKRADLSGAPGMDLRGAAMAPLPPLLNSRNVRQYPARQLLRRN